MTILNISHPAPAGDHSLAGSRENGARTGAGLRAFLRHPFAILRRRRRSGVIAELPDRLKRDVGLPMHPDAARFTDRVRFGLPL